jgi:hypothetical protein
MTVQNWTKKWMDARKSRKGWGPGPWEAEVDGYYWQDPDTGLDCLIKRGNGGQLCGYVGVRLAHSLFGLQADSIDRQLGVSVHGGLTYTGRWEEATGAPVLPYKVWMLGFDCAHLGDYAPEHAARTAAALNEPRGDSSAYKDLAFVYAEVSSLCGQVVTPLEALAAAGQEPADPADFREEPDPEPPCCIHCPSEEVGITVEVDEEGRTTRYRCRACHKESAADSIPPGWEQEALSQVGSREACFMGSQEELIASLGFTPRLLTLTPDEIDAMEGNEFDLFTDADKLVRTEDGSTIARGLMMPYRDGAMLVFEQSLLLCPECGAIWPTHFMIHNALWAAAGLEEDDFRCKLCVEERLGRALTRDDLNDAPLNASPETQALFPSGVS